MNRTKRMSLRKRRRTNAPVALESARTHKEPQRQLHTPALAKALGHPVL